MSCLNRVRSQSAITRGMRIHLGSAATRLQAFFQRTMFQIQFQIDGQLTMAAASYCAQARLGSCAEALTLCGFGLAARDESMPMHRFERSTARTSKRSAVLLPALMPHLAHGGAVGRREQPNWRIVRLPFSEEEVCSATAMRGVHARHCGLYMAAT